MLKHILVFLFLSCSFLSFYGQAVTDLKKSFVPSPEAYSLMQYENIPVSNYTGVTSISIPIYTIQVGNYSLPISLNYHASGIKIAQEASWVGLGWSLSAAGAISRSICGDDDVSNYAVKASAVPIVKYLSDSPDNIEIEGDYSNETGYNTIVNIEPDMFQYSFNGYSGKFYFLKGALRNQSDKKIIVSNPEQNLRIETSNILNGFTITTPENVKYIFSKTERVKKYSQAYLPPNLDHNPGMNGDTSPSFNEPGVTTCWYLSRIDYPTKDTIYFDYSTVRNAYLSPLYQTEQYTEIKDSRLFQTNPNYASYFYSGMPVTGSQTMTSMQYTEFQPRIERIRWKNGYLKFIPGTERRKDIRCHPYKESDGAYSLAAIELYQNDATKPLRTFSFNYSYFLGKDASGKVTLQPDYLRARLKLNSLAIKGTGITSQMYEMEYNPEPLPQKNSYSCDAWGYYNGSSPLIPYFPAVAELDYYKYRNLNNHIIPDGILINKGQVFTLYPDEKKLPTAHAKAGILTALTSPTSGRTEFKYENNQVLEDINWTVNNSYPEVVTSYSKPADESYKSFTVDIPYDGYIEFDCCYVYNSSVKNGCIEKEKLTPLITLSEHPTLRGLPVTESQNMDVSPNEIYNFNKKVPCSAGTFNLTLHTNEYAMLNVILRIRKATRHANEPLVGGLRIAEIKSPVTTRKFSYKNASNLSSGQLNRQPKFSAIKVNAKYLWGLGQPGVLVGYYTTVEYHSSSIVPLENPYNSYFMGYTDVAISETSGSDLIVDKYSYYNEQEKSPRGLEDPGSIMPLNGQLLEHCIYSGGNTLKQKTIYQYKYKQLLYSVLGFKVSSGYTPYNYQIDEYHLAPSVVLDTLYATVAGRTVAHPKRTEYLYHSLNHQVTVTTTIESGETRKHKIYFTVDYNDSNYADAVKKYNFVSTPVNETFTVNERMIKMICQIHYPNEMLSPWKKYNFFAERLGSEYIYYDGKNSLDKETPEITYQTYDKRGCNTSIATRMGQNIVLVWGYHHQHIVAQISNATIAEVQQAGVNFDAIGDKAKPSEADWGVLNSLRTKLPRSQVTVIQYEPLVGVVSETDPRGVTTRYTYDEFSRLKEVIEIENGTEYILQKNEYKYANEK